MGEEQGERLMLKEMLIHRFKQLPIYFEEKLNAATSDELLSLSKRLFYVKTLEELFE